MIAELCESPLTFQAIIIWRGELNEERCSCATSSTSKRLAGPDAQGHAGAGDRGGQPIVAVPRPRPVLPCWRMAQAPGAPAVTFKGAPERANRREARAADRAGESDFDDDDMENSLSLTAIEAKLKPKVVATADNV